METLCIPVKSNLITEIILRSRGRINIAQLVENVVVDFLERTKGDGTIWSEEHAEEVLGEIDDDLSRYGEPTKGYDWHRVFLPNGTRLKTQYRGAEYEAEVRHQQVYFNGNPCSPSQFASAAANNTSRNAWRDLWIKRPGDGWKLANTLRKT